MILEHPQLLNSVTSSQHQYICYVMTSELQFMLSANLALTEECLKRKCKNMSGGVVVVFISKVIIFVSLT